MVIVPGMKTNQKPGRIIGYVSTVHQGDVEYETAKLAEAGAAPIYTDRAALDMAIRELEAGDVVLLFSMTDVYAGVGVTAQLVGEVRERDAALRLLREDIDTSSATGVFILQTLAAVDVYRREMAAQERGLGGTAA